MYYLNDEPLKLDVPFTDADGNQYPANWLRSSTQEQRDALGIVWVAPDPDEVYDQRFYWGVGNPKDLTQLKERWVRTVKETANKLLLETDWYVIRMTEMPECMCPPEVAQYRADVRTISGQREDQINACADVDELAALISSDSLAAWPEVV